MGVGAALAAGSAGMSVVGSIMGGFAKASGDEFEAQQEENAATIGKTQAAQTSTYLTQDLDQKIQTIEAIRGSHGLEDNSPTGQAIVNSVRGRGQEQIGIKVGNILDQAQMDEDAANFYTSSASSAILGGVLGGVGDAFSGLGGAYKAMNSPKVG